ncbi:MAG: sialidase family protein [Archangium sp.]|nr:sialidase family protein [Archangium sp.]
MTKRILGLLVVVLTAVGCRPPDLLTCGDGTRREGGTCVTALRCAAGTHDESGECVADPVTLINCGAGTHLDGTACVIDGAVDSLTPWSAPIPVCTAGVACDSPLLVQTPVGAVVVVSESGDSSMSVAAYRETSAGFVLARRFEGNSAVAMTPTLALRGSTMYLAYTDYEPSGGQEYGPGDLMLSTSADFGITWTAPTRINPMPATTLLYSPRITVSAAGLDLLYTDTDGRTTADNTYLHSDDDGLTWSAPVILPSGSAYDSLSFGGAGKRVGDALEVPVARSGYDLVNGGQLSTVEVLTLKPGPTMDAQTAKVKRVYSSRDFPLDPVPVLDVSEAGVRCMAYVDAPSRDFSVFVVRSEGALDGTQRPVLLPGGPGSVQTSPAIVASPAGDCELAWLDNRSGAWELYEATLKADGTWTAPRKVSPMGFTEDGITKTLRTTVSMTRSSTARQLVWSDFRDGLESVSFSSAPH